MKIILDSNSQSIQLLCSKDKRLAKVIKIIGPISYETHTDSYVFLIHEIIEQMLSIKSGQVIFQRFVDLCDGNITAEAVNSLTDEQIRSIGTANAKVGYIRSLTEQVVAGNIDFKELECLPDEQVMKRLQTIHGIGKWTAKMYMIFVLNRQDILPVEDVAFLQGYRWLYKTDDTSPKAVEKKCRKWKPYSSIAARYLYKAVDKGLTKSTFHLYK